MERLDKFMNEGLEYSKEELLSLIKGFGDEMSDWGTSEPDEEYVLLYSEIMIDGDRYILPAIKRYIKEVRDRETAIKWLTKCVMDGLGSRASVQKEFLDRLRKTI